MWVSCIKNCTSATKLGSVILFLGVQFQKTSRYILFTSYLHTDSSSCVTEKDIEMVLGCNIIIHTKSSRHPSE